MATKKIINNWCLSYQRCDPYTPPEALIPCLSWLEDSGKRKVSSKLVGRRGDIIITKSGSEYTLGVIDPEYEKQFPNAKQRLLKTIEVLTK